ncbi:hypothetical protein [Terrisporobacter mayombei]|uniref:t-SNARE coiled-coil homology domain-containing protein n=1 Tax=Terrisporobacter mayombei TaxID=1541 RepID=A0ABY9PWX2_9FIRM|nr:hypothetical protein [Terrisporobacter mayombei]MCC3868043.1 hypothetical protein [Terrisporobacter mayombei]WMT80181.1 hypothetical protein TEMA_04940 [Terrisporobacter mayombei]
MNNLDGIEEQLEDISSSIVDISTAIDESNQNYSDSGSISGTGLIIIIVLICINNNIKKLTQAIRDKK